MKYSNCPECGSEDICEDWLSGQNRGSYGRVCDRCGHEWDAKNPAEDKKLGDMTPNEQAAAVQRALAKFQAELDSAAPAIGKALEEGSGRTSP